jgi:hypothetical protein
MIVMFDCKTNCNWYETIILHMQGRCFCLVSKTHDVIAYLVETSELGLKRLTARTDHPEKLPPLGRVIAIDRR